MKRGPALRCRSRAWCPATWTTPRRTVGSTGADPDEVSDHAVSRGSEQCGTLGSGNHFLEVQVVDAVLNDEVARAFGLELNQVCVMIHSGSRGLGYQVCDDALAQFRTAPGKYGINLPDRQLACAPVDSPEGKKYIAGRVRRPTSASAIASS